MKIRFVLIVLFLFIAQTFFSQTLEISTKWVENKKIMRKLHLERNDMNELDKFDEKIISDLNKSDIKLVEKEVADLLNYIIVEKIYNSPTNTANAISLLYEKFVNKQYFFDIVHSIAGHKFMSNHYILSATLIGYTKNFTVNPKKAFDTLAILQDSIDLYTVDPQRNGTVVIISNVVGFVRQYLLAVENGDIEDNYANQINDMVDKMGFKAKSSSFDNYPGAKDLRKEYFIYDHDKKAQKK